MKFRDRHLEVEGRSADGAGVELRLPGRGYALEGLGVPDRETALHDDAAPRGAVEQAGYVRGGVADRKPRHAEVRATHPEGEAVIVHIDATGGICREIAEIALRSARTPRPLRAGRDTGRQHRFKSG